MQFSASRNGDNKGDGREGSFAQQQLGTHSDAYPESWIMNGKKSAVLFVFPCAGRC